MFISLRLNEEQIEKIKTIADQKGYSKLNGKPNLSQFIRSLIEREIEDSKTHKR